MSIVVRYAPVPSSTIEQYDEVTRRLQESGELPADGFDFHVAFHSDGQLLMSEVWDSQKELEAFGKRVMPLLADVALEHWVTRKSSSPQHHQAPAVAVKANPSSHPQRRMGSRQRSRSSRRADDRARRAESAAAISEANVEPGGRRAPRRSAPYRGETEPTLDGPARRDRGQARTRAVWRATAAGRHTRRSPPINETAGNQGVSVSVQSLA